jgi:hypothetical protein
VITRGEDAKRIRLLGWEGGGSRLNFYAEHFDGSEHLHTVALPGLVIFDSAAPGESTSLAGAQARVLGGVRTGSCLGDPLSLMLFDGGRINFSSKPKDMRLVTIGEHAFAATRADACEGPEDLWDVHQIRPDQAMRADPVKVASGVTNIAVRYRSVQPFELPDDITAQAPG